MTTFTLQSEYQKLQNHKNTIATQRMQDWFVNDTERFATFSLQVGDILLDYSKNLITPETIALLSQLAEKKQLSQKINRLFAGDHVNFTEKRPALHTALRDMSSPSLEVNGKDILCDIRQVLAEMRIFVKKVRDKEWLGATGKPITDIVNIGIGGSHLGPMMTIQALKEFSHTLLRCHFISNIDVLHIQEVLNQIDPETTLFIISSKSFSTVETISNAQTVRSWLQKKLGQDLQQHFVAVTAAPDKAVQFGISKQQIFSFWDWVGGRYSIWSSIGLPLALMIGMENFLQFLAGANQMDQHFREAPFEKNMPVLMALIGVWYINFFNASQHAIIPYAQQLSGFPEYLQQLDMESNGKRAHLDRDEIDYVTGPVIFGKHGFDGQHSFFQLLHQGRHLIPVDFILVGQQEQDMLIASALSQAQALMQGKTYETALEELRSEGISEENARQLAIHKTIPGNRPSNILFLNQITPFTLGSMLALYEHKTYVQSIIWGINSFDQWGVELGKQLLTQLLNDLQQDNISSQHDASTHGLINHYKKIRQAK
jgi:glucose-6-phosphate isomerase